MERTRSARARYLGDAVYVDVDAFGCLVLTTEDGIKATNTIVLEPEIYAALVDYVEHWKNRQRQEK